jgi:hypothetical protein
MPIEETSEKYRSLRTIALFELMRVDTWLRMLCITRRIGGQCT